MYDAWRYTAHARGKQGLFGTSLLLVPRKLVAMHGLDSSGVGSPIRYDTILARSLARSVRYPTHPQVDLVKSQASTLPYELRSNVRTMCVSPDGALLVAIDDTGRSLVINRKQNALLHHFSFKDTVRVASFSPDGRYLAVGSGRLVQVWCRPGLVKSTNQLELHRTYGHCHSDIVSLDWSDDSTWVAAG